MRDYIYNPNHFSAKVLADSINPVNNERLTTLQITFPHQILPQFNTHRCLVGDTDVTCYEAGEKTTVKLGDICQQFIDSTTKARIDQLEIEVYDQDNDQFVKSKIVDVWMTGERETYLVSLYDGKKVEGTADHLILTTEGWKEIEQLEIDHDQVVVYDQKLNQATTSGVNSVEYTGIKQVYDVAVLHDCHNFIANGIIVHNCFSRNFSSSRAIPSSRIREEVWNNPYVGIRFGSNNRGMSSENDLEGWRQSLVRSIIKASSKAACIEHWLLEKIGLHKQWCNRGLERWSVVTGIVTSTEWENFFKLRLDDHAQDEIQLLAHLIKQAIDNSTPTELTIGEIHAPYIDKETIEKYGIADAIKISVARCCRVSYNNMLGKLSEPQQDIALFEKLKGNMHYSPFEHIGLIPAAGLMRKNVHRNLMRNFEGWYQLRAMIDTKDNQHILKQFYNIEL